MSIFEEASIVRYHSEMLSRDLRHLYFVKCSGMKRKTTAGGTFSDYANGLKRTGLVQAERASIVLKGLP